LQFIFTFASRVLSMSKIWTYVLPQTFYIVSYTLCLKIKWCKGPSASLQQIGGSGQYNCIDVIVLHRSVKTRHLTLSSLNKIIEHSNTVFWTIPNFEIGTDRQTDIYQLKGLNIIFIPLTVFPWVGSLPSDLRMIGDHQTPAMVAQTIRRTLTSSGHNVRRYFMWNIGRHLRKTGKYRMPCSDAARSTRRLIRAYDFLSAIRYIFADDVTYSIYLNPSHSRIPFYLHYLTICAKTPYLCMNCAICDIICESLSYGDKCMQAMIRCSIASDQGLQYVTSSAKRDLMEEQTVLC